MSAHVLLNLLNEFGKKDKMRGLPSILSLFRSEFNKGSLTLAMGKCLWFSVKIKVCQLSLSSP